METGPLTYGPELVVNPPQAWEIREWSGPKEIDSWTGEEIDKVNPESQLERTNHNPHLQFNSNWSDGNKEEEEEEEELEGLGPAGTVR